jgi:hypothetical protein
MILFLILKDIFDDVMMVVVMVMMMMMIMKKMIFSNLFSTFLKLEQKKRTMKLPSKIVLRNPQI